MKTGMRALHAAVFVALFCLSEAGNALAEGYSSEGTRRETQVGGLKCRGFGSDGFTYVVNPKTYIRYSGRSGCWSEVREVEIPIDFLALDRVAQEKGDDRTRKLLSHGNLAEFFTWLLESGRYGMPDAALKGIMGYVLRYDVQGLYGLFREYGIEKEKRRLFKGQGD